jgi:hypothetical protein
MDSAPPASPPASTVYESTMDDKTRRFYEKVEKYGGWQQVPAKRIYEIFEEILEPARIGFASAKPGLLARVVNSDITHLIKLRPLKGASYDICFGASLSYVPYPYVPKVRWHRTVKSANLDLLEEPQLNWWNTTNPSARDVNRFLAQSMLGEKCLREELLRAWEKSRNEALAWFAATQSLPEILQKCEIQLLRKRNGPRHLPDGRMIKAFTLAKLGQPDEAISELRRFFEEYSESKEARVNLQSALEQIVNKPLAVDS